MIQPNTTVLSVALLLADLEDVKEVTQVFRKLGVIPHFYEDLKTFWQGTLERVPSLAIVDVKKMNEGGLILKNHPTVMNEELPILFFYSDRTEPLLVSTQEIYHIGTIKKTSNYEGVFKALLKRINKIILLEQENHHLRINLQSKGEELKKLEAEKENLIKIDHYQTLAKNICVMLDQTKLESDYFLALEKIFQSVDEFEQFGLVELSFNGQKLISPISHVRKFRAIPSLWLGQVCKDGIELFAQNMANQVALEVMGGNVISLLLKGDKEMPEKILFIKTKDELCFTHFDWTMLESFLNGFYATYRLRERKEHSEAKHFHSTFDSLSFLDQYLFGSTIEDHHKVLEKIDYRLVCVDLSSITELILKNGTQRFYWKKFKDDFIAKLELQSRFDFRYFENGVRDLGFLVKEKDLNYFYNEVKEFVVKFPYWKYFENTEMSLFQNISPKVKMSPLSAYGFLSTVNRSLLNDQEKQMDLNHKYAEIAWSKVTENEI